MSSFLRLIVVPLLLTVSACGDISDWYTPQLSNLLEGGKMSVTLPIPSADGATSLERTMALRRSVREYSSEPLTLTQVSQLLWAAQGITDDHRRTAPSAGGKFPLELYVVVGNVTGLDAGLYRYVPSENRLMLLENGDLRRQLSAVSLNQAWVAEGAINLVFSAIYERTTVKYHERGRRYVHIEVGHAAQNVCLQAVALGLGAVTVGAFSDDGISNLLKLPDNEQPLYILPVGHPRFR